MAVPEDITASPAGPSPAPADLDIAALYARLRQEIRRTGTTDRDGDARHGARAAVRGFAERYWAVTAERPIERRPGLKGALGYPLKRLLRPFLRWYVEPLAYEQRMFNDAALKLIDALYEELDRVDRGARRARASDVERGDYDLSERIDDVSSRRRRDVADARYALSRADRPAPRRGQEEARRLLGEVEERLTRTERRARRRRAAHGRAAAGGGRRSRTTSRSSRSCAGRTESVTERQRVYVDDFRDAAPVLDVGCGRGELLALLREAGVEARGIDPDGDMVAFARGEGLDVEQADAVSHLESLEDGSLGGIFMGQVVEHLPAAMLVRTLELAAQKLRPGGVLVAETINPLSPLALRNYFADLTHAQPLVPDTLALLARQVGLRVGRDALPQPAAASGRRRTRRSRRSSSRRSTTRSSRAREDPRSVLAAGAVRAGRRRDPRRAAHARAARARARGRPRDDAVQVVSGRDGADARAALAARRPDRGGRPADRPRDRDEVPVLRRQASEQGRLARAPVPPGVRARPHRARAVRRLGRGPRDAARDPPARPRRARRGAQARRDLAERRRPAASGTPASTRR